MAEKTVRLQFDVSRERLKQLEELKVKIGANTKTELFNVAVTVLRWAITRIEEGRTIASIEHESGT